MVLAGATRLSKVYDAVMAEAVACLMALESASTNDISRVQLETDSALLKKAAVRSSEMNLATEGKLFLVIFAPLICEK